MNKRPLVILTFIFCLGIVVGRFLYFNFYFFYFWAVVFFISLILCFHKKTIFIFFLFVLVFCLGALLVKNYCQLSASHILNFTLSQETPCIIKGYIRDEPSLKGRKLRFIFTVEEIQIADKRLGSCGDTLVYMKANRDLEYGDELILRGTIRRLSRFSASRRYSEYLHNQGIYTIFYVDESFSVASFGKNRGSLIKGSALYLKNKIKKKIYYYLSPVSASILSAMVLGERRDIPPLIYKAMVKTGTVHILVVSGFNVGIVTFIVVLLLKVLRIPRRPRVLLSVVFIVTYCFITGASNPVIRATVMAIIFLLAHLVKREADIYNCCALAVLFILIGNPRQLFDVGFQLSFASVISIVYFYPKIKAHLKITFLKWRFLRLVIEGGIVAFSAWLGTLGLVAYYFRFFSPITVLANMFIAPLAALITLCGFSLVVTEMILPWLAIYIAESAEFMVMLLLFINSVLIRFPYAYFYFS